MNVRSLHGPAELSAAEALLADIWGAPVLSFELLTALDHSGGYVGGSFDADGRISGVAVGILARHRDRPALHSHVTGLAAAHRGTGVGRALKLHQRDWAAAHGIEWITWTFDPLVRRNAWFNLAVLGARVDAYLPSFYGVMSDALNAGDDSDRLHVEWSVEWALPGSDGDPAPPAPSGAGHTADHLLVPTPEDIVTLRRTDPEATRRWRLDTREALMSALGEGRAILGFTNDGHYVIGDPP